MEDGNMNTVIKYKVFTIVILVSLLTGCTKAQGGPPVSEPLITEEVSALTLSPEQNNVDRAWVALNNNDFDGAIKYAQEYIDAWEAVALKQQIELTEEPPLGEVTEDEKIAIFNNWALNGVGTAYFIEGSAFEGLNEIETAKEAYEKAQNFPYARTWDPDQGFFWSPADGAIKNISVLAGDKFEPPDTEIIKINTLIADNKFEDAQQEIDRLGDLSLFPLSIELIYAQLKLIILEDKWAMTLPAGDERTQRMNIAIYWGDHLGLVCQLSQAAIDLIGPSTTHVRTLDKVLEINKIAKASLQENPCTYQPVEGEFDTDKFLKQLILFSDFMDRVENLSLD